jgi:hypothetical protein
MDCIDYVIKLNCHQHQTNMLASKRRRKNYQLSAFPDPLPAQSESAIPIIYDIAPDVPVSTPSDEIVDVDMEYDMDTAYSAAEAASSLNSDRNDISDPDLPDLVPYDEEETEEMVSLRFLHILAMQSEILLNLRSVLLKRLYTTMSWMTKLTEHLPFPDSNPSTSNISLHMSCDMVFLNALNA